MATTPTEPQTGRLATTAADKGRNFGALWTAATASNLADGLVQLVLPLYAARLTASPGLVAGVAVATTLPWLVFALPAGALADRLDRRYLMVRANLLRALALGLLALAAALGAAGLPALYAAALALGVAETIADTAAQTILPAVVATDRLEGANARLLGAQTVANGFVGPPLGGALAAAGVALALGLGAGLYLAAGALLLLLRGGFRPPPTDGGRLSTEILAGLRFLWGHALLRTLALFVFVMNVGWGAWLAVLVLYAVEPGPMGLSPFGYGLLLTGLGIGGVAGSLLAGPAIRLLGRRWAIGVDVLGTVTMLAAPAVTANPWAVGAAAVIGGVGSTMWGVVVTSIRQQAVPDALLGRVSAAFRLFGFGGPTLGAALAGLLGEVVGLRAVFAAGALLNVCLLIPFFGVVSDRALATARAPRRDAAATAA